MLRMLRISERRNVQKHGSDGPSQTSGACDNIMSPTGRSFDDIITKLRKLRHFSYRFSFLVGRSQKATTRGPAVSCKQDEAYWNLQMWLSSCSYSTATKLGNPELLVLMRQQPTRNNDPNARSLLMDGTMTILMLIMWLFIRPDQATDMESYAGSLARKIDEPLCLFCFLLLANELPLC